MTFPHLLIIISTLVSAVGSFDYIRDTLKGKSKPNRVSWSMWALAPLIGTAAALSAGADTWVTVRTFVSGFYPLVVLLASFFNKQSYWKLTQFDLICGVFSFLGIILWAVLGEPRTAIILALVADAFATIPTLVKAWKYPETETGSAYILYAVGVMIALPAIPVWDIQNSAFQVYLVVANLFLVVAVYRKKLLLCTPTKKS